MNKLNFIVLLIVVIKNALSIDFSLDTSNCTEYNYGSSISSFSLNAEVYSNIYLQLFIYPTNATLDSCWSTSSFYFRNMNSGKFGASPILKSFNNNYFTLFNEIDISWVNSCTDGSSKYQQIKYCTFGLYSISNSTSSSTNDTMERLIQTYSLAFVLHTSSNFTTYTIIEDSFIHSNSSLIMFPQLSQNTSIIEQCISSTCSNNSTTSLSGQLEFSDVRFKISFPVEITKEYKINRFKYYLLTYKPNEASSVSISKRFLQSQAQIDHYSNQNEIDYFQDITSFVNESDNNISISLPRFPELFTLLIQYDIRQTNQPKQEKLSLIVNNVSPFEVLKIKPIEESPNFLILLIYSSAEFIIVLTISIHLIIRKVKSSKINEDEEIR